MSPSQLRRRLFIGKPEFRRALRIPGYRLQQLLEIGTPAIHGYVYPDSLASYSSLAIPDLRAVDQELQLVLPRATLPMLDAQALGQALANAFDSIRDDKYLSGQTLIALGEYAMAVYKSGN